MDKINLLVSMALVGFLFLPGAFADVPDGGTDLIRNYLDHYSRNGNVTVTRVAVDHAAFDAALNCVTGTNIANQWGAQLVFSVQSGIETDDVILVAFYARTTESAQETGSGALTICIENRTTYDKVTYHTVTIGPDWNRYYIPLKSNMTLPSSNLNCAFHLGFASQTIQVADVRFINYKNQLTIEQLPRTRATYEGREADAAWRSGAEERINLHRKGLMKLKVVDEEGNPMPGANVTVGMRQHQFGFGTAIDAGTYHANSTYRSKIHELFNEVVFENDLKMVTFYWRNDFQKRRILDVIDELDALNIKVRGHAVVWPSFQYNPQFLSSFNNNPPRLRLELDKHIEEICTMFRGRLIDWDVINEPYSETEFMDILGLDVMANWFNQVQNYDPHAQLYINDFGILSGMGLNTRKHDAYIETIKFIEEQGGRIDGIGMQGHFSESVTSIPRVKTVLDRFDELGKDIKITEFDIDTDDRELQVDYTRDFMTMVFSHPAVKGILVWGFWEARHWRPRAAMYNQDWTIREHGEMFRDLVLNQWWTADTILVADDNGFVELEGYLGRYGYLVENDDQIIEGIFDLTHSNSSGTDNEYLLSFDPGIPAELQIKTDGSTWLCEGEQVTLSVDVPDQFEVRWLRDGEPLTGGSPLQIVVQTQGNYAAEATINGIMLKSAPVSIYVAEYPDAMISANVPTDICPGTMIDLHASVTGQYTYRWFRDGLLYAGSLSSVNTGSAGNYTLEVASNGCRSVSEPLTITVLPDSHESCATSLNEYGIDQYFNVYPNPFTESIHIQAPEGSDPFSFKLISMNGNVVYKSGHHTGSFFFTPHIPSGIYLLEILESDRVYRSRIIRH